MKKRCLSLILMFALLGQLLSGCAAGPAESAPPSALPSAPVSAEPVQSQPGPVTVTDQAGREVTLDAPAERIVS